jgi:hypothetical protein
MTPEKNQQCAKTACSMSRPRATLLCQTLSGEGFEISAGIRQSILSRWAVRIRVDLKSKQENL